MINDVLRRIARLSLRAKLVAGGAFGALAILLAALIVEGVGRGCSSREDVTARVGIVSSGLQQAAAQGKINIERLAEGIKRVNAAATAYENSKDHQAYCDALDALSDEFELGE